MEYDKIYCEDCIATMEKCPSHVVDLVLTSPPYNTSRKCGYLEDGSIRYEDYDDSRPNDEYIDWTCNIFNHFDGMLKENGGVLYNMSYSAENVSLMWRCVTAIMERTPFTLADCIIWKKQSAVPNNRSSNKLTRICEFVFVFCRKVEFETFKCYKEVASVVTDGTHKGQLNYKNYLNF